MKEVTILQQKDTGEGECTKELKKRHKQRKERLTGYADRLSQENIGLYMYSTLWKSQKHALL